MHSSSPAASGQKNPCREHRKEKHHRHKPECHRGSDKVSRQPCRSPTIPLYLLRVASRSTALSISGIPHYQAGMRSASFAPKYRLSFSAENLRLSRLAGWDKSHHSHANLYPLFFSSYQTVSGNRAG